MIQSAVSSSHSTDEPDQAVAEGNDSDFTFSPIRHKSNCKPLDLDSNVNQTSLTDSEN